MSNAAVTLPERAGSRGEAQHLVQHFPTDLAGQVVRLDGHNLAAGSSSFMDELVKELLEVRGARELVLDGVTERSAAFARSSADRRHVASRLTTRTRP